MLYNEETITQAIHTKWAGKTVHFLKKQILRISGQKHLRGTERLMERWQ